MRRDRKAKASDAKTSHICDLIIFGSTLALPEPLAFSQYLRASDIHLFSPSKLARTDRSSPIS